MKVHLLWHVREFEGPHDDGVLLGVFSSMERAEEAKREAVALPGFRDLPNAFHIDSCEMDKRQWPEGYVSPVNWDEHLWTERSAIVERFWAVMNTNDFHAAGALLADDFVLEWPQSGERVRGRDNFAAVNENYPSAGPWRFTVRRLVPSDVSVVSDVEVTDGTTNARVVTFHKIVDGRIARQTEYWPDPFPAAAWRAQWVEQID